MRIPRQFLRLNFFLQIYIVVLIIFSISSSPVHGVSLDSDGYYDIVIAIDEKTAQNENEDYLTNLKGGIQDLSHALYETTSRKFLIRSADIVLPNHWHIDADAFVTTQTYADADFRISHEYSVPQTINPTFCGYPGHHIELPYSFFDKYDEPYGPTGKALLTLWARYRWGIFEEHGYPGDLLFPYFWKVWAPWTAAEEGGLPEVPEPWNITSCSNAKLKGTYKAGSCLHHETNEPQTILDEICDPSYEPPEPTENPEITTTPEPDDPYDLYPPPSECRFCPVIANQTATTSVMAFPFIKSLLNFCDETTHNKRAPNRQNFFCQFKSAWEVIRESKDWKQRKEGTIPRIAINFRILKKTEKPLLILLSDGVNKPPDGVITTMTSKLSEMFEKTEHWNVLVSAGVFPGQDVKDSYDTVYNWNTPWHNTDELITAFQQSFESRHNAQFRNFGAALQDIGNQMRDREHSPGAVVVMIKYGNETDSTLQKQWQTFEFEALAAILPQNIRVFVLEGVDNQADVSPKYRLKNIAELTGGLHLGIGNGDEEDAENVNSIMSKVEALLTSAHVPASKYRLAYKDTRMYYSNYEDVHIPVPVNYGNVKSVFFYFHSQIESYKFTTLEISKGPDGVSDLPLFDEHSQWGRTDSNFPAKLGVWTSSGDPLTESSQWTCTINCQSSMCHATIVAIVELDVDLKPEKDQETSSDQNDIQIEIFTSAQEDGNVANLITESVTTLKGVAFSIYAKLEKNGHPIYNPDIEVMAHVCHYRDGLSNDIFLPLVVCQDVNMLDSGPLRGDLDLTANDGIFTANYIPAVETDPDLLNAQGIYQIFVTARLLKTISGSTSAKYYTSLPVDQEQIRCGSGYLGCWIETVTEPFFVHSDMTQRIQFIGRQEYPNNNLGAATRVLDLSVSLSPEGNYNITWTEPAVYTELNRWKATAYEMYFAHNFDDILQEKFKDKIYGMPAPGEAGQTKNITLRKNDLEPGEKRWFVMRSVASINASQPVWSNVLFLPALTEYYETTTTTTTTTTPTSTPTTVRLSSSEPVSTTLPTRVTTAPSTTKRQRPTQSTTGRESTTLSTTTRRLIKEHFEAKNQKQRWYKSAEAIVTFSVFGVGMAAVAVGVLTYLKLMNRAE